MELYPLYYFNETLYLFKNTNKTIQNKGLLNKYKFNILNIQIYILFYLFELNSLKFVDKFRYRNSNIPFFDDLKIIKYLLHIQSIPDIISKYV